MRIGFIDYYLDEWHANNYPAWIQQAGGGELEVACAYAMIDSPLPGGRTTAQWCADMGIPACASIEEVIACSDALIVLSPDNAEMHETLCQLPLRSGKPTYVDKTFAPDGETARRLFALAEDSGTPCFSTSALRYASEYQVIDRKAIQALSSWGPGNLDTYAIHQVEPIVMLMQDTVERVQYLPGRNWYSLAMVFSGGRSATVTGFLHGSPFSMNIAAADGNRVVMVESEYFTAFIQTMVAFFRNKEVPVSHAETLCIMDTLDAAFRSREKPGIWMEV